ncbi:exopolysaccharide biosynthesis protein [Marinobacter sp. F3R08]|uniref:exopolysaccharide biosynthesis protein n=1 Tax=Marinobacter sp. F3R08 TaxID=2841559 RepID=UPI001C09EADF|nr:exopolysaccharide biosynthesis protein [Marinobacter sp. F3R08]MBU2953440.1 exopolysaccharide biosynthesis protein [Marinobacter sp. F3R08]
MNQPDDPASLKELLNRLRSGTEGQSHVSMADVLSTVGERSFGPVVLIAGLITLAPLIGDIPGVPTLLGLMVLLTLGQLLFQRHSIWIPSKLAQRHVERETLVKGLDWMEKPTRFLDHWTKPRLSWLVRGPGQFLVAIICMTVAAAMPLMEVIPFSANGAGLALMAFGLSIVARDGLLALFAITVTGGTGWFILNNLPW